LGDVEPIGPVGAQADVALPRGARHEWPSLIR
jgi:hypothetical protein